MVPFEEDWIKDSPREIYGDEVRVNTQKVFSKNARTFFSDGCDTIFWNR